MERIVRNSLFVFVACMLALLVMAGGCDEGSCATSADCASGQTCTNNKCTVTETVAEPAVEPSSGDGGVPTCPNTCKTDRDCVFCGDRKTCDTDTGTCVDIRVQCPKVCNKNEDCSRAGCGARTTCNIDIHECVERIPACPDTCATDADCTAGGCGPRSQCNKESKTCVDPTVANCPFVCQDDAGCTECGARNKCSFSSGSSTQGICREFRQDACPATCQTTADCFTKGCGTKLYCNYALGTCVEKDQTCPFSCTGDADCGTHCGNRTYCYQSAPGVSGYCAIPPQATACPATCRYSFDCKAKECGDKAFCSLATQTCVTEKDACPGRCQSNADCPATKCGSRTVCRNGRCYGP